MSKKPYVTCLDNGKMVMREDAYYVPSKKRYFSSKEAYERWSRPDPFWNKVIGELISDVEFPSNLKLPGVVLKRLQDDYKGIGFEPVYMALLEKKQEIEFRMRINDFENYTKRLNYILAMIRDDVPVIAQRLKKKEVIKKNNDDIGLDFDVTEKITDNHKGGQDLSFLLE